ncbi:hypothetical protein PAXRUDRAFT_141273, partial [Paxillus rubicundulus Ve08.2h10]
LPMNRPSPSRTRVRTPHATEGPSRTRGAILSGKFWRTLPYLLFRRSHNPPRRAELTTIYPSPAADRVYVASRDDESTSETSTEAIPTAPGHYRRFSILVESVSSTGSLNENQPTPAPPTRLEKVQVSCCTLFSYRRARSGTTPAQPATELTRRIPPTSTAPPQVAVSSHFSTQNILDLPAVSELPPGMA